MEDKNLNKNRVIDKLDRTVLQLTFHVLYLFQFGSPLPKAASRNLSRKLFTGLTEIFY